MYSQRVVPIVSRRRGTRGGLGALLFPILHGRRRATAGLLAERLLLGTTLGPPLGLGLGAGLGARFAGVGTRTGLLACRAAAGLAGARTRLPGAGSGLASGRLGAGLPSGPGWPLAPGPGPVRNT